MTADLAGHPSNVRGSCAPFSAGNGPKPCIESANIVLAPGGPPDARAVTWAGRHITYAELDEMIARAPTGAPVDVPGMALPQALACVFAAARAGTSVLVRDPALPAPDPHRAPAGTWLVAATSGTTRAPHAVYRSAASWAASVAPLALLAGLTADDRVLITGPLHATLHLHAAVHTLAIGAEVTDDPLAATAAHAVPAALAGLLDALPARAPLRTAIVAGAALPEALADRAAARGVAVTEYYGAAELSFVAARRLPDPLLRPFPGVAVRLDASGVLWVRSPYLALGRARGDGYATVGDIASAPAGAPEQGLVIRGRGESVVTTGGFTVLVEEVEAVLRGLPGVRAVAVLGLPHARLGQVVTAVLELEPGANLAAVRAGARPGLTPPARPRRYVVVDALPRTGAGKIDRAALPARCA